ncbi:AAA family ATPase [Rhizobium sp. S152]|uniref:ExeA family protein n=1 Tax=Rhizobium sp. S152 TaxID=3055038 RepID=UPI0025AA0F45|nr:AAA family ATPase [Rhizobium sp. S152]MDM9624871.1 AAA family ATPase [Rhizobium sp. S152]
MYEQFYGLTEKPFSILPDPKFLYFGQSHTMAFSMLEYGLVNQAGFTVITGAVGSGKTTLIQHFLASMNQTAKVGMITHTTRAGGNLLEWILMAFGQGFEDASYPRLYKRFCEFVEGEVRRRGRVVLIIDEAQNLEPDRLEELRMLSNMNTTSMMMQLILVGQPELRTTLRLPELRQFAQRISSDFHLPELQRSEARAYIDHRVRVAGGADQLFSPAAKTMLFEASKGVPRQINVLADRCLVYAFAKTKDRVSSSIVRRVLEDRNRYGIFASEEKPKQRHEASEPHYLASVSR